MTGGLLAHFVDEARGFLACVCLLQAAIESVASKQPARGVVYRACCSGGGEIASLYCSEIGEVVVWPAFTSASRDRSQVLRDIEQCRDGVLFEITLGDGAIAANASEEQVVIAAESAFRIDDVVEEDMGEWRVPIVKIDWVGAWSEVDLECGRTRRT
jgi:hypothetical protein